MNTQGRKDISPTKEFCTILLHLRGIEPYTPTPWMWAALGDFLPE